MRPLTPAQITRRYEEGFGKGEGASYRPWLGIHDVPSIGVSTRVNGWKSGRKHVTFSDLEEAALLCAQRQICVIDIREQFPLFPLEETIEIAEKLGVSHPSHTKDKSLTMMTTDLLLTEVETSGILKTTAIAVKPSELLEGRRTLEKLEIERIYWASRRVSWGIVTEKEMQMDLIKNLIWINGCHKISSDAMSKKQIDICEDALSKLMISKPDQPLNMLCSEIDEKMGLETGSALGVVRHCISNRKWSVDLEVWINPTDPPPQFALMNRFDRAA